MRRCWPFESDGTNVELPAIRLRVEGKRYRFVPNGLALVYAQGPFPAQDFWLLDLATKKSRQLTRLQQLRGHAVLRRDRRRHSDRVRPSAGELRHRPDRPCSMTLEHVGGFIKESGRVMCNAFVEPIDKHVCPEHCAPPPLVLNSFLT